MRVKLDKAIVSQCLAIEPRLRGHSNFIYWTRGVATVRNDAVCYASIRDCCLGLANTQAYIRFCSPQHAKGFDVFIKWITDTRRSPWRDAFKTKHSIVRKDKKIIGIYFHELDGPYYRLVYNFMIASRLFSEFPGRARVWYDMVQKGYGRALAYILCSHCVGSSHIESCDFSWAENHGGHWPFYPRQTSIREFVLGKPQLEGPAGQMYIDAYSVFWHRGKGEKATMNFVNGSGLVVKANNQGVGLAFRAVQMPGDKYVFTADKSAIAKFRRTYINKPKEKINEVAAKAPNAPVLAAVA